MRQREQMVAEVKRWRESGLTKKEYCQQQGIKEATFNYWIARSRESKKKGFVPLTELLPSEASLIEIIFPNGVRIKIAAGDLKMISQLISLC